MGQRRGTRVDVARDPAIMGGEIDTVDGGRMPRRFSVAIRRATSAWAQHPDRAPVEDPVFGTAFA